MQDALRTEKGHLRTWEGFLQKVMSVLSSKNQAEVNQKHVHEMSPTFTLRENSYKALLWVSDKEISVGHTYLECVEPV